MVSAQSLPFQADPHCWQRRHLVVAQKTPSDSGFEEGLDDILGLTAESYADVAAYVVPGVLGGAPDRAQS